MGWMLLWSLEPLKALARKLKGYLPGILDDDYFFLKIRAAFPGIAE